MINNFNESIETSAQIKINKPFIFNYPDIIFNTLLNFSTKSKQLWIMNVFFIDKYSETIKSRIGAKTIYT